MKTKRDIQTRLWATTAIIMIFIVVHFFNEAFSVSWAPLLHATGVFISQMSPVYSTALMILLGLLAYIAFKVKRAEHLSP